MKLTLRNMDFSLASVNKLVNVALVPEVQRAVLDWVRAKTGPVAPGVLIGGLALSFYAKPRATTDVDLLFLTQDSIPDSVRGFKRIRPGAFQENSTHVEVETSAATTINIPISVAKKVFDTAVEHDGLLVASIEGLAVLKLYGSDTPKRRMRDLGDVVSLLENNPNLSIKGWAVTDVHIQRFNECKSLLGLS